MYHYFNINIYEYRNLIRRIDMENDDIFEEKVESKLTLTKVILGSAIGSAFGSAVIHGLWTYIAIMENYLR